MHSRSAVLIGIVAAAILGAAWAAGPAIGIATANGDFRVDRASVSGNATVLEGSLVETGLSGSQLRLYEGTGMRLGSDSRGKVFLDRLVLEQGAAEVSARGGYAVDAGGLRVLAAPDSAAEVNLTAVGRIEVGALSGGVRVTNGSGVLLAQVVPGRALAFAIQVSGAAPPEKLTGVLTESKGHYFLTDSTAGVRVELSGSGLEQAVGKVVEVTGTLDTGAPAAESAAHVVNVISIRIVPAAAKTAAAAGIGTKIASAIASHAVIAGVGVAAAGAAAAVAITQTGQSTISR
jgi:hypothetical protein